MLAKARARPMACDVRWDFRSLRGTSYAAFATGLPSQAACPGALQIGEAGEPKSGLTSGRSPALKRSSTPGGRSVRQCKSTNKQLQACALCGLGRRVVQLGTSVLCVGALALGSS